MESCNPDHILLDQTGYDIIVTRSLIWPYVHGRIPVSSDQGYALW